MTDLAFIAPFPPHTGGIAYCSRLFLEQAPPELRIHPFGFRSVFPRWLHPGSGGGWESLPAVSYPFSGFNPFTWRRAAGLLPGQDRGFLILPWWTAALAPATLGIIRHFKRTHPGWKTLLWCHNVRDHEARPFARRLTASVFGRADGFVVHSQAARDELLALLPDASVLAAFHPLNPLPVPLPVREETRRLLGVEPRRLMVLFLGTVRSYKGLDTFLEAARLLQRDPRFHFRVAGDFWRGARGLIPSLQAAGVQVEPGFLSWERMAGLLAAADLLVLPYHRASGSGILMTAYAHGVPVLASAVPPLTEFLPREAPTVPPQDAAALAAGLGALADTPEKLEALKERFMAHAPLFGWDRFFALLQPFLERLEND